MLLATTEPKVAPHDDSDLHIIFVEYVLVKHGEVEFYGAANFLNILPVAGATLCLDVDSQITIYKLKCIIIMLAKIKL